MKRLVWEIKMDGKSIRFSKRVKNTLLYDVSFFNTKQKAYLVFKRVMDMVLSFILLILLSPLFIVVSLLILITSGAPVFFTQQRIGQYQKPIKIYKFRTLKTTAPKSAASGNLKDFDSYVTKIGKFLRITSLDEVPQLINVLKGDMSLIGPRPIIPEEVEVHTLRKQNDVYLIRPGITGLAQVNGRDFLNPEKKVFYDTNYVKNISFYNDFRIMLKSIVVVFSRADVLELKLHDVNK